jgi:hypothetical protein
MPDDFGKVLAGHLGVAAVLANVVIDQGIISRDDLCDRFRQARNAAAQSIGGPASAQILGALLNHLEQADPLLSKKPQ